MPDYVLSVWKAGDEPGDGAPIRLCRVGNPDPVAVHPSGFDTSAFRHDGQEINPEWCLTGDGLMDGRAKAAVGEALWARLAPDHIAAALTPLIRDQERIYLDLRSDGLQHYPWELLRYRHSYPFIAPHACWLLGRPEPRDHPLHGTPPQAAHPLRMLVVIGNDPDDENIRAEPELLLIEREAHRRNDEVLLTTLHYPSAPLIATTLTAFRPHILHFIGHGGSSAAGPPQFFVHSAKANIKDPWDADRVRSVFSAAPPRIVVLNACLTARTPTTATSLVDAFADAGCIATVAMMGEIRGAASEAFSERFYREIFNGAPVDSAATSARLAVSEIETVDLAVRSNWALPRVTVHGDADSTITMRHATQHRDVRWLKPDFVGRWAERWQVWKAMDGSYQGSTAETESRLVVLCGEKEVGKSELMNTMAESWARAGGAVLYVDLFGGTTGGWQNVLQRIAAEAATNGFDATTLRATAGSAGESSTVIPQFLNDLEQLKRPGGDGVEPVLVVLDGLGVWAEDVVRQTVLPLLCRPFVRAARGSRLHMMISLRDTVNDSIWGQRPTDWKPIVVGNFDDVEWKRDVEHFRNYWYPSVAPALQGSFTDMAKAVIKAPVARSLRSLRYFAGGN